MSQYVIEQGLGWNLLEPCMIGLQHRDSGTADTEDTVWSTVRPLYEQQGGQRRQTIKI